MMYNPFQFVKTDEFKDPKISVQAECVIYLEGIFRRNLNFSYLEGDFPVLIKISCDKKQISLSQ